MTRGDEHRIEDIRAAASNDTVRLTVPYDQWIADEDLRLVTERLIEVIGEAARAMTDDARSMYPEVD